MKSIYVIQADYHEPRWMTGYLDWQGDVISADVCDKDYYPYPCFYETLEGANFHFEFFVKNPPKYLKDLAQKPDSRKHSYSAKISLIEIKILSLEEKINIFSKVWEKPINEKWVKTIKETHYYTESCNCDFDCDCKHETYSRDIDREVSATLKIIDNDLVIESEERDYKYFPYLWEYVSDIQEIVKTYDLAGFYEKE